MSSNPPPYTDYSNYSQTPPNAPLHGNYPPPQSMPMPQPGYEQQQPIYQPPPPPSVPTLTVVTQQPCKAFFFERFN